MICINRDSRLPFSLVNPLTKSPASTRRCSSTASSCSSPEKRTTISRPLTVMVWTEGWLFKILRATSVPPPNRVITMGLELFTWERMSRMLPVRAIRPWSMIPTSVHSSESSESTWELRTMVFPWSLRSLRVSRKSNRVLGSRPAMGSSRIRTSGSWIRALARHSLCFIPLDSPST